MNEDSVGEEVGYSFDLNIEYRRVSPYNFNSGHSCLGGFSRSAPCSFMWQLWQSVTMLITALLVESPSTWCPCRFSVEAQITHSPLSKNSAARRAARNAGPLPSRYLFGFFPSRQFGLLSDAICCECEAFLHDTEQKADVLLRGLNGAAQCLHDLTGNCRSDAEQATEQHAVVFLCGWNGAPHAMQCFTVRGWWWLLEHAFEQNTIPDCERAISLTSSDARVVFTARQ